MVNHQDQAPPGLACHGWGAFEVVCGCHLSVWGQTTRSGQAWPGLACHGCRVCSRLCGSRHERVLYTYTAPACATHGSCTAEAWSWAVQCCMED